jgi:phage terminase large subunit GpA-like protein
MYVHPTLDNGKIWDDTKWQPFLASTVDLHKAFPTGKSRNDKNRAYFKQRSDKRGFLRISGANSSASLSMITIRRMVKDDVAKWENNEAGDPDAQANNRLGAYEFDAKCLSISTPLVKDLCRISRKYDQSDKRKYMGLCPHCGHRHSLEWENFKGSIAADRDPSTVHFMCPACGAAIEQQHREAFLASCMWVPTQTDRPRQPGYHLWQAYSTLRSWSSIAAGWIDAKDDPDTEQTFYNDVLGLEYEQKGEAPPWEGIAKRAKDSKYPQGIIPPHGLLLVTSVDVQDDRMEWLLSAYGPNMFRANVQHGVIDVSISHEDAWLRLDALLKRKWKNFLGRDLTADLLVIDMGDQANEVKAWVRRHPIEKVIAIKGRADGPPIWAQAEKKMEDGKSALKSKRFWNVGTGGIKAAIYKHLEKIDETKRGFIAFANDFDEEHFKQLCSERRKVMDTKQGPQVCWEKIGDVRNEILDLNVYGEAGARRLNWTTAPESEWERLRAEREKAPDSPQLDFLDPTVLKAAAAEANKEAEKIASTPEPDPPKAPPAGRTVRSKGV